MRVRQASTRARSQALNARGHPLLCLPVRFGTTWTVIAAADEWRERTRRSTHRRGTRNSLRIGTYESGVYHA